MSLPYHQIVVYRKSADGTRLEGYRSSRFWDCTQHDWEYHVVECPIGPMFAGHTAWVADQIYGIGGCNAKVA